jgi:hypothetical protein
MNASTPPTIASTSAMMAIVLGRLSGADAPTYPGVTYPAGGAPGGVP